MEDFLNLKHLAPVYSFKPDVFRANNPKEQEICDFVLSLALVYNDIKDIIWFWCYVVVERRQLGENLSAHKGQLNAMDFHCLRIFSGIFHELNDLIKGNLNLFSRPTFKKTINQLPADIRKEWLDLVSFANQDITREVKPSLKKKLLLIRNNSAFHYGQFKKLSEGYENFFCASRKDPGTTPYISRGLNMQKSRFYFADAAMVESVKAVLDKDDVESILEWSKVLNRVLNGIVDNFILARGGSFRKEDNL